MMFVPSDIGTQNHYFSFKLIKPGFLTIFVDFGVAKIVAQKIVKLFLRLALDWTTSNSRELPMVFSTVYR